MAIVPPAAAAAPSKPVIIPTRTRSDRRSGGSTRATRDGGDGEETNEGRGGYRARHGYKAVPASAAAFLAMTDIQRKSCVASRPRGHDLERYEAEEEDGGEEEEEEEEQEVADTETSGIASSASSPRSWRLLLSPPQDVTDVEDDKDDGSRLSSGDEDTRAGSFPPMRSLSNESMPSLDTDNESAYTSSNPSTPGVPTKSHGPRERRRSKSISSSIPEDCNFDHPLLIIRPVGLDGRRATTSAANDLETNMTEELTPISKPSLRSNLTASFRRLKTAARIFSNFASPTPSPSEDPTPTSPSAISKIVPERRPLPWAELPNPALRRYLNPITVSPAELYSHRHRDESGPQPTSSIQMQTYWPGARKSEKASAPPVFVLAPSLAPPPEDEPGVSATTPRQREPRENSDFLRMIVLEMNMRKEGKLSGSNAGRARLWLPARQASSSSAQSVSGVEREIPRRWVSIDQ
ncbi:MAG: hypothetical protein Q9219_003623 [cf. Caloplaca sp. 3 TL-2023]